MEDKLTNFFADHVALLREKAAEAKAEGAKGDPFQQGRHIGLYESLSLMHQQAIAFGIDLASVGMAHFDPDRDAL